MIFILAHSLVREGDWFEKQSFGITFFSSVQCSIQYLIPHNLSCNNNHNNIHREPNEYYSWNLQLLI